MTHYFIFAGEPSGDLHGGRLMQAIKELSPSATFSGVGGPQMRMHQMNSVLTMEDFRVMGFTDVLINLPRLCKQFFQVRKAIIALDPECVILIDYPGFNLRLAKSLRSKGYIGKIVQYISPTVWAHGKKRIETMTETLDLLLTIFPFEAAFFAHSPLKVRYVGNPLVENIHKHIYQEGWLAEVGIPTKEGLVALFPGSRPGEIQRHGLLQLEAAAQLKKKHPEAIFAFSYLEEEQLDLLKGLISQSPLELGKDLFLVRSTYNYELMRDCHAALAKSGTVTLEIALHHQPSVVVYNLSTINYYIAKYLLRLRLPYYCIVNIIMQKEIFPEFINKNLKAVDIEEVLEQVYHDSATRNDISMNCVALQNRLGRMETHLTAAKAIEELLK